jgi:caffeoyl-CoA O-methyltransferase
LSDELRARFDDYIGELFAPEDDALILIQNEAQRSELPPISVRPADGRLLQLLIHSIGARTAVEIGTLAGYSGTWIARALPDDGRLYTVEMSAKHAQVSRANFERAGVGHKVEIIQGPALEMLAGLSPRGPFDFVFIDADKSSYLGYLRWAVDNLRPGGIVTAHNAYRDGRILEPENDDDVIMRDFLSALASDDRLISLVVPLGDGMAIGLRR